MSRQTLALIFSIIFLGLSIGLYARFDQMQRVKREVEELNDCLDFATTSAVQTLKAEYGSDNVLSLTYEEFFRAYELRADNDVSDIYLFVPAFVYCDTKGYYVGALDPSDLRYKWSDLKPYKYSTPDFEITFGLDNSFIVKSGIYEAECDYRTYFTHDNAELRDYEISENSEANGIFAAYSFELTESNFFEYKSDAMIKSVEESVSDCINNHNVMASSYGIEYIYTAPPFYMLNQEYPSFVVCFQGYPLISNGKFFSNLYVRSGYIDRKN